MSSRYRHECPDGCKVFIGNLDRHVDRDQVRDVFGDFGRVRDVWLATNPPGFGFVMFEHRADAKNAVKGMNNQRMSGRLMTVELATGLKRHSSDGEPMDDRTDRQLSRDGDQRRRDTRRSGSGDRRARYKSGRYDRSGDRCFYSSSFQRMASPSNRRRRRSVTEDSDRQTRSPAKREDKQRSHGKNRIRRRSSDH